MEFMQSKKMTWIGWGISILCVLPFLMGILMQFSKPEMVTQGMAHMGIPISLSKPLFIVEVACLILYLIPQTAVFGAILLAGYMGGAIMTHLRIGEPVYLQIAIGVLFWLGIWLREPSLRAILPLRR